MRVSDLVRQCEQIIGRKDVVDVASGERHRLKTVSRRCPNWASRGSVFCPSHGGPPIPKPEPEPEPEPEPKPVAHRPRRRVRKIDSKLALPLPVAPGSP